MPSGRRDAASVRGNGFNIAKAGTYTNRAVDGCRQNVTLPSGVHRGVTLDGLVSTNAPERREG